MNENEAIELVKPGITKFKRRKIFVKERSDIPRKLNFELKKIIFYYK